MRRQHAAHRAGLFCAMVSRRSSSATTDSRTRSSMVATARAAHASSALMVLTNLVGA